MCITSFLWKTKQGVKQKQAAIFKENKMNRNLGCQASNKGQKAPS